MGSTADPFIILTRSFSERFDPKLTRARRAVYNALAYRFAPGNRGLVWASQRKIAEAKGISRKGVQIASAELESMGLIDVIRWPVFAPRAGRNGRVVGGAASGGGYLVYMLLHTNEQGHHLGDRARPSVAELRAAADAGEGRVEAELAALRLRYPNAGAIDLDVLDGRGIVRPEADEEGDAIDACGGMGATSVVVPAVTPPAATSPAAPVLEIKPEPAAEIPAATSETGLFGKAPAPATVSPRPKKSRAKTPGEPDARDAGFDEFWRAYPADRRGSKSRCLVLWRKKKLAASAEAVLASLADWKASELWTKESGRFVCGAPKFLDEERYENPAPAPAPAAHDPDDPMAAFRVKRTDAEWRDLLGEDEDAEEVRAERDARDARIIAAGGGLALMNRRRRIEDGLPEFPPGMAEPVAVGAEGEV